MSWWGRQRNILDFTLSSLLRRKGKNLGLLLVYTLVVAALASVMLFLSSLRREAQLILADCPEILVQRMVAGRHDLVPEAYAQRIRDIRGVSAVRPRLWGYWYDPVTRANYTLMVPAEQGPPPGTVRIGEGISLSRQVYPGDILSIKAYDGEPLPLVVDAVLSHESQLVSADLMLLGGEDFRRLFGIPVGLATDLSLRVPNEREVDTIALKVSRLLPDTRVVLRSEIRRTYDAVFDWRGGMIFVLLGGALLAFIIFSWDKASGLSAEERREIGILKAVGWETSDVLLLKFWEGMVVSLTSFLAGLLLACLHIFVFQGALIASVIKGWSVLYPDFRLLPAIQAREVATLFFLTVVPYTAATVIPSWRAAIVDPDAVMRA